MTQYSFSVKFKKILKILYKKNKKVYEILLKKIKEISENEDIEHYKNLKHDLKRFKRIHMGHFVLIFKYNKEKDLILFENFAHHDRIYKR